MGGGQNKDDQFQGSLNADEGNEQNEQNEQNVPENLQGLDLGAILGGLMGGGQQGGMPDMQGGQGGLDLGALLGGLLGGRMMGGQMGGQAGDMSDMGAMSGMAGTPFDGIIGSVAGDLSAKTGLPKEIITMGAMFLISKLLSGGLGGNQQESGQQAGGLDLGGLLGSLLGGGALPGMGADQGSPQQNDGDQVLGKIGSQIGNSLNSPQLTTSGLQQSGLASEFSQMSGLSEDDAAQSLNQIVNALKQSGLGQ